ncbi:hypothetical protein BpHYR1_051342 [Brachionus plicatilis]|uniref:Uncharacterized protein n=1 Tax=Brachionus plicatilis TaxID=10195 RepID=A0A3M7QCK7_BRAPC|nr:hypothetical protein BpHYR1_051342 [Brachionus plicatilis]
MNFNNRDYFLDEIKVFELVCHGAKKAHVLFFWYLLVSNFTVTSSGLLEKDERMMNFFFQKLRDIKQDIN